MKPIINKLFISTIFLLSALNTNAQSFQFDQENADLQTNQKIIAQYIPPGQIIPNAGFLENWNLGNIVFENGKKIQDVFLFYDCILGELIYLRQKDLLPGKINKEYLRSFQITDKRGVTYNFIKVSLSREQKDIIYMQTLNEDNISLYKAIKYERQNDNSIIKKNTYYTKQDETFSAINLNIKSISEVLGKDKKELRSMKRKNRIKLKDERLLIRFFEIIN